MHFSPFARAEKASEVPEGIELERDALEESAPQEPESSEIQEEADRSVGRYVYWDDGWIITGPMQAVELMWNAKIDGDIGYVDTDRELESAFPSLQGSHARWRRLDVALLGEWKDKLQFKIEASLSDANSIKDEWIRFIGIPFLSQFTFGHMKEPFSIGNLTSSTYTTFMERSLPTRAFSPSRNIGMTMAGKAIAGRLTLAGGVFLNTGSYGSAGNARDQINSADG